MKEIEAKILMSYIGQEPQIDILRCDAMFLPHKGDVSDYQVSPLS